MSEYAPTGDWRNHRRAGMLIALAAAAVVLLVVLVNVLHTSAPEASPASSSAAAGASGAAGTSGMAGMSSAPPAPAIKGIPTVSAASLPVMSTSAPVPMAMVPLGNSVWDGMSIQARTSAPATFELFNGSSGQIVHPTSRDSFHLMVVLSDAHTGVAIPYSSVWATIRTDGKIVFDERLWPMISRYMGPHYGNNVVLPGAGLYHLTLLVSPPTAARHLEYRNVWLTAHRVQLTFRWQPKGS